MKALRIKVCGITRAQDAVAACSAGADLLGFVFARQSPRRVTPDQARRIIAGISENVSAVGVFAGEEPAEVERIARECGLSFVQLHGPGDGSRAVELATPVIRVIRVGGAADLAEAEAIPPGLLLLDARVEEALGGTGRAFDWPLARALCGRRPVIVAGGLTPANVGEAVRLLKPWGVDVSSGVEAAPGVKDPGKIQAFIRAARAAAGKEG